MSSKSTRASARANTRASARANTRANAHADSKRDADSFSKSNSSALTTKRSSALARGADNGAIVVERMPAPPPVTREEENAEYTRAGLTEEQRKRLDEELEQNGGYWGIDEIRSVAMSNSIKQTFKTHNDAWYCGIDAEMMMMIDARTQIRVFVDNDNIYTREELVETYPFDVLKTTPEEIFAQQEVGVFPPKKYAENSDDYEYIAREVGSDEEFIMIEDMVGEAARRNYKKKRAPYAIYKTKIYFASDRWEQFQMMQKLFQTMTTFAPALEGGNLSKVFAVVGSKAPMQIRDAAGVEEDRDMAAKAAERERLEKIRQQEEAIRLREEELRRQEEEMQWRREESIRIEKKLFEENEAISARMAEAEEARRKRREEQARRQAENARNAAMFMRDPDDPSSSDEEWDEEGEPAQDVAAWGTGDATQVTQEAPAQSAPSALDILDEVNAILGGFSAGEPSAAEKSAGAPPQPELRATRPSARATRPRTRTPRAPRVPQPPPFEEKHYEPDDAIPIF